MQSTAGFCGLIVLLCIFDAFRMIDLIKNPVLTEKSVRLIETHNQYMFDVDPRLTKPQIRELVQTLFGVRVLAVNTHCPPRKTRRMGATTGAKPRVKRAIVSVAKDQKIRLLPSLPRFPRFSSLPYWRASFLSEFFCFVWVSVLFVLRLLGAAKKFW